MKEEKIILKPIGFVRSKYKEKVGEGYDYEYFRNLISEIVIFPQFVPGLLGIEREKYIYVLYWMHKVSEEDEKVLQVHPRGERNNPLTGVFVTRSPRRPNPIALCVVELLEKKENVLKVRGLDALDNSPVLDIKRFAPEYVP